MTCLAFAEHNAREGCVYETFAALLAHVRARHAPDPRLRRVFARVAADEVHHAQLSWDLDAWFRTQLDANATACVETARGEALASLATRARALAQPSRSAASGSRSAALAILRSCRECSCTSTRLQTGRWRCSQRRERVGRSRSSRSTSPLEPWLCSRMAPGTWRSLASFPGNRWSRPTRARASQPWSAFASTRRSTSPWPGNEVRRCAGGGPREPSF